MAADSRAAVFVVVAFLAVVAFGWADRRCRVAARLVRRVPHEALLWDFAAMDLRLLGVTLRPESRRHDSLYALAART